MSGTGTSSIRSGMAEPSRRTFILVAIFALKTHVFSANLRGGEARGASALFSQVRATMLVTVSVFLI